MKKKLLISTMLFLFIVFTNDVFAEEEREEYIIQLEEFTEEKINKIKENAEIINISKPFNFLLITASQEEIKIIKSEKNIKNIEKNVYSTIEKPKPKLNTLKQNVMYSSIFATKHDYEKENKQINVSFLWDKGLTGKGINIAVIDGGVQLDHEDLEGVVKKSYICQNFYEEIEKNGCEEIDSKKTYKYNVYKNGIYQETKDFKNNEYDDGHGTHVAGIIASNANDKGRTGIAYNSKIYSFRIFDTFLIDESKDKTSEQFSISTFNEVKTLEYIFTYNNSKKYEDKIHLINMSLGGYKVKNEDPIKETERFAENYAIQQLEKQGVIVVAASGNDAKNFPHFPSGFEGVLSVGAVNEKGELWHNDEKGVGSNIGKVDVVAPGVEVCSTVPKEFDMEDVWLLEDGFYCMAGTSMSTPFVTGMLALYKEAFPHYTPNQLKKLLYEGLEYKKGLNEFKDENGYPINYEYGRGILKANTNFLKWQSPIGLADELYPIQIQNNGVYDYAYLMDNTSENYTYLETSEWVKFKYEGFPRRVSHVYLDLKGATNNGLQEKDVLIGEDQKLYIEFQNENEQTIGEKRITGLGWNELEFDQPFTYFVLKNKGTKEMSINEFELLDDKKMYEKPTVKEINQTIFKNGTLDTYETIGEGYKQIYVTTSDETFLTKEAYGWLHDKQRFEWYKVSIPGFGEKWIKPSDKEVNPIYMEGIFDAVEGKIVQNKTEGYNANFNDNKVDSSSIKFRINSNDHLEYRLKQPVNVDTFFLSIYNKVNLENTTFEFQFLTDTKEVVGTYQVKKEDNIQQLIKLPRKYENVSRIIVKKTGNNPIELSELEFFDSKNTSSHVHSKNDIEISNPSDYTSFRDAPIENSDYKFLKNSQTSKNVINKAYGWIANTQQYAWYLVSNEELGIKDKWIRNNYSVKMPYQNGVTDKVKASFIEKTGSINWTDRLLDNRISSGVWMFGKSSMEYQFEQFVQVKSAFINFEFASVTVPSELDFTLELLDENRNVILTHQLTEDDVFYGYFKLSENPITAKGFRLTNHKNNAYPDEFELFDY